MARQTTIRNGKIRQSVMAWCFKPMTPPELAAICREIGIPAIEGLGDKFYPEMKKAGLDISLVGSHGFKTGVCNPLQHETVLATLKDRIDLAAELGFQRVITFTGMLPDGMSRNEAFGHSVDALKKIAPYAEKHKVTLCLEHLNTRDDTHPMKGHPGYYGDDVDEVVAILNEVNSRHVKLLFDIYHVQIMNGDVIKRINQYHDIIGHYHTAGVPGRAEIDDTQEVNYPAVMKAILATDYQGYVAQEFIPTWDDKAAALRHAAQLCDVS